MTSYPQNEIAIKFFGIIQVTCKGQKAIKKMVPTAIKIAVIAGATTTVVYVAKKGISYLMDKKNNKNNVPQKPNITIDEAFHEYKPSEAFNSEKNNLSPMVGYMLPEGFDSLVYGMKGTMKSFLVLGTMIQVGLGEYPQILPPDEKEKFHPPVNVRCIYADGENGRVVFTDRYKNLGARLDPFMDILEAKSFGNDMDLFFEKLFEMSSIYPSGTKVLLGVDNIKSLLNDHSYNESKHYLNKIRELRERLSSKEITLTTITLCHTVKEGDKISGTYDLACLTSFIFKVDKMHHFTIEESRTSPKGTVFSLKVVNDGYTRLVYASEEEKKDDITPIWNGTLSLEDTIKMKEFYREGVPGFGRKPTAQKFGLLYPIYVKRELEKLEKYLSTMSNEDTGQNLSTESET